MARLLSVNVGLPSDIAWKAAQCIPGSGRSRCAAAVGSAGSISKEMVRATWQVTAVSSARSSSIRLSRIATGRSDSERTDFVPGQFGENFTIEGLPDDSVCIGDRYQIGNALFEVTQPRVTCYRVGIRLNEPRMPALLTSSGRPGFYLRVLQPGEVGADDEIVKVGEATERMTVAEINALLYSPHHPRDRSNAPADRGAVTRMAHVVRSAAKNKLRWTGNAGLVPAARPSRGSGVRSLEVAKVDHEPEDVLSMTLRSPDGGYCAPPARPVRGPPPSADTGGPPLFRSYSLSGANRGRIPHQREDRAQRNGGNVHPRARRVGDRSMSARREEASCSRRTNGRSRSQRRDRSDAGAGDALRAGETLDARGVVAARRARWQHHPFAAESVGSLALPRGRGHLRYSRPGRTNGRGLRRDRTPHARCSTRSGCHATPTSTSVGLVASCR